MAVLFEGRIIRRTESPQRFHQPPFPVYRWRVEKALQGVTDGAEIDVLMAVTDDPGTRMSGDIGPAPFLGARYRVGAYRGGEPRTDLLFTNVCGGALQLLEAPPPTIFARKADLRDEQGASLPTALVSGLSLALGMATAVGLFLTLRRRRVSRG